MVCVSFFHLDFPPICLPVNEPIKSRNFDHSNPFLIDYGITSFGDRISNVMLQDQVVVIDKQTCKEIFDENENNRVDEQYSDRVICAGVERTAKCQYDAGSPLMMPLFEHRRFPIYQIGVTTFGYSCINDHTPGIYASVQYFSEWIVDELKK